MWGFLRIILLVGNATFFAWFGYFVVMEAILSKWWQYLFDYGLLICLALNVVYLWLGKGYNWRIFHLIRRQGKRIAQALSTK